MLLYRKGLQEFLAACGVLEPSANTQAQDGAFAEGGAEGPRRIIFDVENISEHRCWRGTGQLASQQARQIQVLDLRNSGLTRRQFNT